jgi:hypothetical protein
MSDFWHKITKPYRRLKWLIHNLITWIPIIWSDRWYDRAFLLRIIAIKCENDAKSYRESGHSTVSGDIANELNEVASICRRLIDEHESYFEPFYSAHTEKWKEAYASSYYPRSPLSVEQERTELKAVIQDGENRLQQDLNRLGELFKKVMTWWD